jgi:phosphatidylglycerol:prolipoprotein diacylglycerol transferase
MNPGNLPAAFLNIATVDLVVVSAFILGAGLAFRRAPRFNLSGARMGILILAMGLALVVGTRAYFVLLHLPRFSTHPDEAFHLGQGGTAQYGGIILALVVAGLLGRHWKVPFADITAMVAPSFFLGLAVGRLACLVNGCCFGLPTSMPWGMQYPEFSQAAQTAREVLAAGGVQPYASGAWGEMIPPVHPVPLYSVAGALLGLSVFLWLERTGKKPALLASVFFIWWGMLRFILDFFRYYPPEFHLGILTINQLVSLFFIAWGFWLGRREASWRTNQS